MSSGKWIFVFDFGLHCLSPFQMLKRNQNIDDQFRRENESVFLKGMKTQNYFEGKRERTSAAVKIFANLHRTPISVRPSSSPGFLHSETQRRIATTIAARANGWEKSVWARGLFQHSLPIVLNIKSIKSLLLALFNIVIIVFRISGVEKSFLLRSLLKTRFCTR